MDKQDKLEEGVEVLTTRLESINNYKYNEMKWKLFQRKMKKIEFDGFDQIMDFVRSCKYGLASTLEENKLITFEKDQKDDYTGRFKNIRRHGDFIAWDNLIAKDELMSCTANVFIANSSQETISIAQKDIKRTAVLLSKVAESTVKSVLEMARQHNVVPNEITNMLCKTLMPINAGFKDLNRKLELFAQVVANVAANNPSNSTDTKPSTSAALNSRFVGMRGMWDSIFDGSDGIAEGFKMHGIDPKVVAERIQSAIRYKYDEAKWESIQGDIKGKTFDDLAQIIAFFHLREYGIASTLESNALDVVPDDKLHDLVQEFKNVRNFTQFAKWDKEAHQTCYMSYVGVMGARVTLHDHEQYMNRAADLVINTVEQNARTIQALISQDAPVVRNMTDAVDEAENQFKMAFNSFCTYTMHFVEMIDEYRNINKHNVIQYKTQK